MRILLSDQKDPFLYDVDRLENGSFNNTGSIIQNNEPGGLLENFEFRRKYDRRRENIWRKNNKYYLRRKRKLDKKYFNDDGTRKIKNTDIELDWGTLKPFNELNRNKVKRNKKALARWIDHKKNIVDYYNKTDPLQYYSGMVPDVDKDLTAFVKKEFRDYLNSVSNIRAYIFGKILSGKDAGKFVTSQVYNRFTKEYGLQIKDYFEPLQGAEIETLEYTHNGKEYTKKVDLDKSVFLTLTYDPNIIKTKEQAWIMVNKDLNRFKTRLFQIVGHHEYIWTIETQPQTGYPHFHMTMFGIEWLMENGAWSEYKNTKMRNEKPTIENIWKRGFTRINKTETGETIKQPMNYMFKYFTNTWGNLEQKSKGFLTMAYLWFFNKHTFGISRGLGAWLDNQKKIKTVESEIYLETEIKWMGLVTVGPEVPEIKSNDDLLKLMDDSGRG